MQIIELGLSIEELNTLMNNANIVNCEGGGEGDLG